MRFDLKESIEEALLSHLLHACKQLAALFASAASSHLHSTTFAVYCAATRLWLVRYGILFAHPAGIARSSTAIHLRRVCRCTVAAALGNCHGCHYSVLLMLYSKIRYKHNFLVCRRVCFFGIASFFVRCVLWAPRYIPTTDTIEPFDLNQSYCLCTCLLEYDRTVRHVGVVSECSLFHVQYFYFGNTTGGTHNV